MQYRVLRNIACREGGQAIRLNTYIAFDERRAKDDNVYRESMRRQHPLLRGREAFLLLGLGELEREVEFVEDGHGRGLTTRSRTVNTAASRSNSSNGRSKPSKEFEPR